MVFHMYVLRHVGSGPLWPKMIESELVEGCEIHWWKLLLYIQNIFGRGKAMVVNYIFVNSELVNKETCLIIFSVSLRHGI